MNKALVIIPTYLTEEEDLSTTMTALDSIAATQDRVDVLAVDDGSPEFDLVVKLRDDVVGRGWDFHRKDQNTGFASTTNLGLKRALENGQDAILMNADVECDTRNWFRVFRSTQDVKYRPAAVVGALLLFPNGTVQSSGTYFSYLSRTFDHRFKYAPGNLPAALEKAVCPVTAAFKYIRHSTLETVGLLDEGFPMGWDDVDFDIRVLKAGLQCVYNPAVRAYHYESMFRGRPSDKVKDWQNRSFWRLCEKYEHEDFSGLVPPL